MSIKIMIISTVLLILCSCNTIVSTKGITFRKEDCLASLAKTVLIFELISNNEKNLETVQEENESLNAEYLSIYLLCKNDKTRP